ncbi:MAG: adenylyltransferase/cytidyltransferase family protein [bacterium]
MIKNLKMSAKGRSTSGGKKVLVFGTFDIFHEGHKNFLKQARLCGEFLQVVIARDKTVKKVKGREVVHGELARKKELEESGLADKIVLGSLGDKYAVVKEFAPDVICLGYDQQFFVDKLEQKLQEFGLEKTKIVHLKSHEPEKYKSSLLRKLL